MILEYFTLFTGVLVISYLLSLLLTHLGSKGATWRRLFHTSFFLGIVVHELTHYLMCLLTHVRVAKTRILPKQDKEGVYNGYIKPAQQLNFFQSILIGFAPLFIGTYIIGFILYYIFNPAVNFTIALFLIYIAISIVSMICPSRSDVIEITHAINQSKIFTLIQVGIILIVLPISYYLISMYNIVIFDSLLTLFFMTLFFYYIMKYCGFGINYIIHNIIISRKKIKYTKYKVKVKHRRRRDNEFSPRTQW